MNDELVELAELEYAPFEPVPFARVNRITKMCLMLIFHNPQNEFLLEAIRAEVAAVYGAHFIENLEN